MRGLASLSLPSAVVPTLAEAAAATRRESPSPLTLPRQGGRNFCRAGYSPVVTDLGEFSSFGVSVRCVPAMSVEDLSGRLVWFYLCEVQRKRNPGFRPHAARPLLWREGA